MRILDLNVGRHPRRYVVQCGLATVVLIILFTVEDVLAQAAVFSAIGSTTFIIFVTPNSRSAHPRHVIGGHLVGVVVGSLAAFLLDSSLLAGLQEHLSYTSDIVAALAVGVAMLTMALTRTEHPPGAGTALGLVLVGWDMGIVMVILSAAVFLALSRRAFLRRLDDLD